MKLKLNKNRDKYIVIIISFILSGYILYASIYGVGTMADALRGFELMKQYNNGNDWNTLSYPNVHGDYSFFVSWWAPGQWMIPYCMSKILGNNLQIIQLILVISCTLTGLFFYYRLFRVLQFTQTISLLSILFICCNQLFYWHFFLYYGGDLFVFSLLPIFLIILIKLNQNFTYQNFIYFVLITFAGLFFKNTFLVFFCSALFFLFISGKHYKKGQWKKVLLSGAIFIIVYGLFYFTFLRHGETPSTAIDLGMYDNIPNNFWGDILYPLGSSTGVITRITPGIQKVVLWFKDYEFVLLTVQLFIVVITFFLFRFIAKKYVKSVNKQIVHLSFYFAIPIFLFFIYFYLSDKAVSYEMRHFAPISFLFLPMFTEWILSFKKWKKVLFAVFILLSLLDLSGFYANCYKLNNERSMFNQLVLRNEDVKLMSLVQQWDYDHSNGIIISKDNWLPVLATNKNDKTALFRDGEQWKILSGIELDFPPIFNFEDLQQNNYDAILLILPKSDFLTEDNLEIEIKKPFSYYSETDNYILNFYVREN